MTGINNFRSETFDLINHPHMKDENEDGKFELFVRDYYEDNEGVTHTDNNIEMMLIPLIIGEVVFLNTPWHRKDLSEEDRKVFVKILVICNDIFAWGCADCTEIEYNEIPDLYDMWLKDPVWGGAIWCIKKSNYMPQKPVYDRIQAAGIWNLDEMGLRPNVGWSK